MVFNTFTFVAEMIYERADNEYVWRKNPVIFSVKVIFTQGLVWNHDCMSMVKMTKNGKDFFDLLKINRVLGQFEIK